MRLQGRRRDGHGADPHKRSPAHRPVRLAGLGLPRAGKAEKRATGGHRCGSGAGGGKGAVAPHWGSVAPARRGGIDARTDVCLFPPTSFKATIVA
jgi:hypothetical protein